MAPFASSLLARVAQLARCTLAWATTWLAGTALRGWQLVTLCGLACLATTADARPPALAVEGSQDEISLSHALELLEDRTGGLSFQEVAQGAAAGRFVALTEARQNVGYSSSAFWLRITLTSPRSKSCFLAAYQAIDEADLYLEPRHGPVQHQQLGRGRPFFSRPVPHKTLYFPVELPAGETRLFLRVRSADTLQLQLALLSPLALGRTLAHERLKEGLYFGAMGALCLYNLFLFLWLQDRAYLYYFAFQASCALLQACFDQLAFQHLWPSWPRWNAWSETFFVGLTLFGAFGFARCYLALPDRPAPAARVLRVMQWASGALALAFPLTQSILFVQLAMVFVVGSCCLVLGVGLAAWRSGSPNAPFFVAAWAVLLLGTVVGGLTNLGLLEAGTVSQEATRAGSLTEAILLSLGLAHRINLMRRHSTRVQADLLHTKTEYAEQLERDVAACTRELRATLDELKQAQASLVRQARLAALGHLIEGVIHEVGNPLNFVHGGVDDVLRRLKRAAAVLHASDREAQASPELRRALDDAATAAGLVREGSRRIAQLITNLRRYASGRTVPFAPTDVSEIIRTTATLLAPRLHDQGIALELDLVALPAIDGRPGELAQVLTNLIHNAGQAMPAGGQLTIRTRLLGDHLSIVVEDTGYGVPIEIRECIFDPFFTTRAPNEGTGLGLAISHEIVYQHRGSLRLLETERGAAFEIALPLSAA